jgi:dGTPase
VNHDVDDAIRAGVLDPEELPHAAVQTLGATHSERIDTLVTDLVTASDGVAEIGLSQPVFTALDQLRDFLFAEVYLRTAATDEHDRAIRLLRELFAHFLEHPDQLPPEYHRVPGDLPTRVADFIAGMTDRYAVRTYEQLFLPRGWLL